MHEGERQQKEFMDRLARDPVLWKQTRDALWSAAQTVQINNPSLDRTTLNIDVDEDARALALNTNLDGVAAMLRWMAIECAVKARILEKKPAFDMNELRKHDVDQIAMTVGVFDERDAVEFQYGRMHVFAGRYPVPNGRKVGEFGGPYGSGISNLGDESFYAKIVAGDRSTGASE